MPLTHGLRSFESDYNSLTCSAETLTDLFDCREEILRVLAENSDLVENPYPCRRLDSKNEPFTQRYAVPSELPFKNPIYAITKKNDLLKYAEDLSVYSDWNSISTQLDWLKVEDRKAYADGYSLIDACIYLVHILNIYEPNRTLIQNLLATHKKIDALGREDFMSVRAAIDKIVKKSIEVPFYSDRITALIVIARHDAALRGHLRVSSPGVDFERECENRLQTHGFEVQTTPASGDFGADIIAIKDGLSYAIQCKDTSKPVGVKAVQEARAARSHYNVDFAVVCAVAGYTDAAVELASSNKVLLCNLDQLVKRLDGL